ncbi:MAG TPA: hypothetical protein VJH06_00880 [Candidatus Paceibacterota bacterium]
MVKDGHYIKLFERDGKIWALVYDSKESVRKDMSLGEFEISKVVARKLEKTLERKIPNFHLIPICDMPHIRRAIAKKK